MNIDFFHCVDGHSCSSIHAAVYAKDINKLEELVRNGKCINIINNNGYTPLHVAVAVQNLEAINFLTSLPDIDLNIRSHGGETALWLSVSLAYLDIASKLIESGADVNIANLEDVTPLHIAVQSTHYQIVKSLLNHGAVVNVSDADGYTPLHEAVQQDDLELVCMMLYYGADCTSCTDMHLTPFMLALNSTASASIQQELFMYEVDFNSRSLDECTLLFFAINNRSHLCLDIIKSGGNLDYCVEDRTSLDMALYLNTSELFDYIWPRFDFKLLVSGRYSIFMSVFDCEFPTSEWLKVAHAFIECDHARMLIDHFFEYEIDLISKFINAFKVRKLSEGEFINFLLVCLYQGVNVSYNDVQEIFYCYGHNEAMSTALMFGDVQVMRKNIVNVPYLLCNITQSVQAMTSSLVFRDRDIPAITALSTAIRTMVSRGTTVPLPSLVELSRNQAREAICSKYNIRTIAMYYYVLKRFKLPKVIFDILTFRKPVNIV